MALHHLLFLASLVLSAQSTDVLLTVNPDSTPRAVTAATAIFKAEVISTQVPSSVTLCLVSSAGAVLSTHGEMHDDGIAPDQTASDKKYALQLQLPVDKVGTFMFVARAQFNTPVGQVDSMTASFSATYQTPTNTDGEFWVNSAEETNYINYFIDQLGIRRVKIYRADSAAGPWTVIHDATYTEEGGEGKAQTADPDPVASADDRYYKVELYDASAMLKKTYSPILVPAYSDESRLLLLTGSPLTSEVISASDEERKKKDRIREKAVSSTEPWNWAFISDEDFECYGCMSLLQIRDLFSSYNSFLSGEIQDVDAQLIDPAQLVYDAAREYQINPQLLLARMQAENGVITKTARPSNLVLRTLMGCGGGGNLQTSIRAQIDCAAETLRLHFDAQSQPNGRTVSGWRVGEAKLTQHAVNTTSNPTEGLWVTPATKAAAALYTYTPYRGREWGGVAGGNALVIRILRRDLKLYALYPFNTDHELYDENGVLVHRFLTHNRSTGEYTFDWSVEPPYVYNTPAWLDGGLSGIMGYLPGRTSYDAKVSWGLNTYDYCKRESDIGDPLDYNFYNGDCFVASINTVPYWELQQTWEPSKFYPFSANIVNEPGYIALEGGLTKPPVIGPFSGHPSAARASTAQQSISGDPGVGRILNIVQDSEHRAEYPAFPSWGKVKFTIK